MGEARAKRRREQRAAAESGATLAPQVPKLKQVTLLLDQPLVEQIRRRHETAIKTFGAGFPPLDAFYRLLLVGGIDVFDNEIDAYAKHARGESRSVDPTQPALAQPAPAQPEPDRLVLSPDEVPAGEVATLKAVADGAVPLLGSYRGKRTR